MGRSLYLSVCLPSHLSLKLAQLGGGEEGHSQVKISVKTITRPQAMPMWLSCGIIHKCLFLKEGRGDCRRRLCLLQL